MGAVTLTAILRTPLTGVDQFQAYEDRVLPLLAVHGGRLLKRLRNPDGTVEVHILQFDSGAGLASYRQDPLRVAAAPLLTNAGTTTELIEVVDVT